MNIYSYMLLAISGGASGYLLLHGLILLCGAIKDAFTAWRRSRQYPVQQWSPLPPEKSQKDAKPSTKKIVPLPPLAAQVRAEVDQRRKSRVLRPLWQPSGTTGEVPAVGTRNTEAIDMNKITGHL